VYLYVISAVKRDADTVLQYNGVGTNFGVGVDEARPEGPRARDGVLEEGTASPSSPLLGVCGSAVSSLSGVRGGAPAAEGFSCILSRQIAFPRTCCMQFAWLGIRFF